MVGSAAIVAINGMKSAAADVDARCYLVGILIGAVLCVILFYDENKPKF